MFERLELLIGEKVKLLNKKTVLLLGLGGVGGHAFEALVRSNIGTIIIVDNDTFDVTNLNRQLLSTRNNISKYKVDIAEERNDMITENTKIIKINKFIDETNIEEVFKHNIDFVIDAIDTIKTKELIIKKCLKNKIKFISVMGTGGKMDNTKLKVIELSKTSYDPIAKIIRSDFRKENIKDKIMVVSSDESPTKTKPIGSNAFVPATAGLLAAGYAINTLLKEE